MVGKAAGFAVALVLGCAIETSHQAFAESFVEQNAEFRMIDSIKVVRRGKVRRAKLYYLRGRRGKAARITEKQDHRGAEGAQAVEKAAE